MKNSPHNDFSEECRRHKYFQIGAGIASACAVIVAWAGLWLRGRNSSLIWQVGHYIVAIVITVWLLYRFYKLVGRRCQCGRIFALLRLNKMYLAPDETISIRSTKKRLRWWIRRVFKETFIVCECGRVECVKRSTDPVSVFHAWWVKLIDRRQYFPDPRLAFASQKALRRMGTPNALKENPERDTPPFRILPTVTWDPPDDPEI